MTEQTLGANLNPYQVAASTLSSPPSDPELFKLYLTTSMTKMDAILNSNNNSSSNNDSSSTDSFFSGITDASSAISDLYQSSSSSNLTADMLTKANLIGKTADGFDPTTNQNFSGKITAITVESGKVLLLIGDQYISPEYVTTVKE